VLTWLVVTFAVAIGSALFPPLSVEVFAVAMAARHPQFPVLLFAAVIALGQVAGKLLYYYAALGRLRLPDYLHKHTVPRPVADRTATSGIRRWWAWLRMKCHRHPRWMFAALAFSSLFGLPPFLATTVLAGLAGLSLRAFVIGTLPGRFVRFAAILASPTLLRHWVHWAPLFHHFP
jgi:membrane protein YqaA with SNARE-associated domain